MKVAIAAAIIQDEAILLVKKKETWILPGGKPESGESDEHCLNREVGEELSRTQISIIGFYGEVEGISPNKGDPVKVRVYLARINGQLNPPSAEISEACWVRDRSGMPLSDPTTKIFDSLQKNKFIVPSRQKSYA